MTITVIQVFKALDVLPQRTKTWPIGSHVAALYREEFGHEPPKELRPKTKGGGTHCFAVYPDNWFTRIADAIREFERKNGPQGDLWA